VVIGYGFMVRAELARAIVGRKRIRSKIFVGWLAGWFL